MAGGSRILHRHTLDPNQPPAQDPPSRVARISILQGQVSFQPATVADWAPATLNYPVTIGDHLYADADSRAELQVGSTAIRLGSTSAMSFLNLDDHLAQIRVDQGALILRVKDLDPQEAYEIDTAQGAITILRPGEYRIDCDPDRNATMVTVRSGDASVNTNAGSFPVHPQQTAFFGADGQGQFASENPDDGFDQFSLDRDRQDDQMPPPQYISQNMPGWQDLQRNGQWMDDSQYGPVWRPTVVEAGWAPYRNGHWAWIEPWGWTWIDDAPWGFAPFHYGRWAMVGGGWAWVPGPVARRPVYAPALVAFVGGAGFAVGVGGGMAAVAWFPLGPREVFVPAYRVSPVYVNRVNVTTVNITNVTVINRTYVNRTYVTAVDQRTFVGAQPVHRAVIAVPRDVAMRAQVGISASVAPQRISVMGHAGAAVNVPRPAATITARPVFAQRTPPPAPVPFAARQQALQANPGRPLEPSAVQQLRTTAPVRQPAVRTLPPSNPQRPAFPQNNTQANPNGQQFGRQPDRPFDRTTSQPAGNGRVRQRTPENATPSAPAVTPRPAIETPRPAVERPAVERPAAERPAAAERPTPQRTERPAAERPAAVREERPAAKPAPKKKENKREEKKEEK
jgi:hypothetical protein